MAYQLERLTTADGRRVLAAEDLQRRIGQLVDSDGPRLRRLWAYYRNPMRACPVGISGGDRPYRQAQEWGMPARITGVRSGREVGVGQLADEVRRKEVVIENDIGWRVEALVDYLFGKHLVIDSTAPEPRRAIINQLISAILEHNGGVLFFQQLALLGAVYGFVDVLVKFQPQVGKEEGRAPDGAGEAPSNAGPAQRPEATLPPPAGPEGGPASPGLDDQTDPGASIHSLEARIARLARMIRLEIVEPARALPVLSNTDYRVVEAYAQHYRIPRPGESRPPEAMRWWERLWRSPRPREADGNTAAVTEIITPTRWQRYEDERLVAEGVNSLGEVPLAHIQNTAVPFEYAGASDVEGLIPLQDELNTRLSDRANRITLQSFKMYLGKCINGFLDMPVEPGRMWLTDDTEAEVIEFGGSPECGSETLHIADIREAMDKTSGVSPIAAGAIKNRIGRLTSAAALRITLISLLAKTDKKRTTYGLGIQRMIELALKWLDVAGLFPTAPDERGVELHWPSPLPENLIEKLQEAEAKTRLGVPKDVVLRELGY